MTDSVPHPPPLPARPVDGHKGTFGRVLILAGSRGMSGAACLAGQSCLRGGAGLVFLGIPESILSTVAAWEPSYLTIPLPEDADGRIAQSAQPIISEKIANCDVFACGPGLGQSDALRSIVGTIYSSSEKPGLFDADALNLLASAGIPVRDPNAGPRILTPHPGEFSRLIETPISEIEKNREELATQFASEHQIVLVLKGHQTFITDGSRTVTNSTGNNGLATGGSGDVLTGLIAALLGQRMEPFEAAQLGVYLHGKAAELASEEFSEAGVISSDLPKYVAYAWKARETEAD